MALVYIRKLDMLSLKYDKLQQYCDSRIFATIKKSILCMWWRGFRWLLPVVAMLFVRN